MNQSEPIALESRLLLACAKVQLSAKDEAAIRQVLDEGIDWTAFAQQATDGGVASLAAHALIRIAPDLIPDDILGALRTIVRDTRTKNHTLLDELARSIASVESPPLAIQRAHAAATQALTNNPNDAAAWRNLGNLFSKLKRHDEAIVCYDRATVLVSDDPGSWRDRGIATFNTGKPGRALIYIDKALALDSDDLLAWTYRAHVLSALERIAEAVEASDRALALDPQNTAAARANIHALLFSCDWRRREDLKQRVNDGLRAGKGVVTPFNHLAISDSEESNLSLARLWATGTPQVAEPLWRGERYHHDKIRIAYISTDFRDTLSVNAIAGGFEEHDKARFETTAISLGPDDRSDTRRRLEAAFSNFIDVQSLSDAQVAAKLRELEVDIAIDLNGYAGNKRPGILARRPAPVQVNYLGFAGTMGMPFLDYIIADSIVIPKEHQIYYTEKVVYLPNTFFPTDRKRRVAEYTPRRVDIGLPETGFVFTCHNTVYKISPEIFDVWMRLLRAVEGSVLWLGATDPLAMANLRREAKDRGVAPARLVFGPWVSQRADHLARLRLADLFLDTLPYNAHTTACDALWAGLPLLTCRGNTFPARVAASLLHAIGLPELVTTSLDEYEQAARTLSQNPQRLAAIRSKLLHNRDTEPLFDTARFTRHLESAYASMWKRHQAGLPPASFAVLN
jgi:protein O-GlcNAc transferase